MRHVGNDSPVNVASLAVLNNVAGYKNSVQNVSFYLTIEWLRIDTSYALSSSVPLHAPNVAVILAADLVTRSTSGHIKCPMRAPGVDGFRSYSYGTWSVHGTLIFTCSMGQINAQQ